MFDAVAAHPLLSYAIFASVMLLLGFAGRKAARETGVNTPNNVDAKALAN